MVVTDVRLLKDDELVKFCERDKDALGHGSDPHGGTKEKDLKKSLKVYCGNANPDKPGSNSRVMAKAEDAIRSGKADENAIVTGIRDEKVEGTIYRGMFILPSDQIASWKEGQEVQIMPSSFSKDEEHAGHFANGEGPTTPAYNKVAIDNDKTGNYEKSWDKGVSVVLEASGLRGSPIHGIDVDEHFNPRAEGRTDEHEVITGGTFKIGYISRDEDNVLLHIGLSQTGVF